MAKIKVCAQDCPKRSAECRLTCEDYKVYEAEKRLEYEKRKNAYASIPTSPTRTKTADKKRLDSMRGRKR